MSFFEIIKKENHEQVIFCSEQNAKLTAIIAIHNTTLGPSLGGTRMWTYASDEEALRDVLRLSKGMTYKAALAGLNLGGGKAVIIGDPLKDKTEILFRTFGRFINGLAGRYITAEDVGTDVKDMEYVRMETKYVTGIPHSLGGSGDPSPVTAYGVYVGMKAAAKSIWGNDSLAGRKVVIQGVGHVGTYVGKHLEKENAKIYYTDIIQVKLDRFKNEVRGTYIKPDEVFDIDAEIFCPCALGAILNDDSIPKMKYKLITGGANNQLAEEHKHAEMLKKRNILYIPDYLINAGGLINVANEIGGNYNQERALSQAGGVYDTVENVVKTSKEQNILTIEASNRLAEERLEKISKIKQIYSGNSNFSGRLGEIVTLYR